MALQRQRRQFCAAAMMMLGCLLAVGLVVPEAHAQPVSPTEQQVCGGARSVLDDPELDGITGQAFANVAALVVGCTAAGVQQEGQWTPSTSGTFDFLDALVPDLTITNTFMRRSLNVSVAGDAISLTVRLSTKQSLGGHVHAETSLPMTASTVHVDVTKTVWWRAGSVPRAFYTGALTTEADPADTASVRLLDNHLFSGSPAALYVQDAPAKTVNPMVEAALIVAIGLLGKTHSRLDPLHALPSNEQGSVRNSFATLTADAAKLRQVAVPVKTFIDPATSKVHGEGIVLHYEDACDNQACRVSISNTLARVTKGAVDATLCDKPAVIASSLTTTAAAQVYASMSEVVVGGFVATTEAAVDCGTTGQVTAAFRVQTPNHKSNSAWLTRHLLDVSMLQVNLRAAQALVPAMSGALAGLLKDPSGLLYSLAPGNIFGDGVAGVSVEDRLLASPAAARTALAATIANISSALSGDLSSPVHQRLIQKVFPPTESGFDALWSAFVAADPFATHVRFWKWLEAIAPGLRVHLDCDSGTREHASPRAARGIHIQGFLSDPGHLDADEVTPGAIDAINALAAQAGDALEKIDPSVQHPFTNITGDDVAGLLWPTSVTFSLYVPLSPSTLSPLPPDQITVESHSVVHARVVVQNTPSLFPGFNVSFDPAASSTAIMVAETISLASNRVVYSPASGLRLDQAVGGLSGAAYSAGLAELKKLLQEGLLAQPLQVLAVDNLGRNSWLMKVADGLESALHEVASLTTLVDLGEAITRAFQSLAESMQMVVDVHARGNRDGTVTFEVATRHTGSATVRLPRTASPWQLTLATERLDRVQDVLQVSLVFELGTAAASISVLQMHVEGAVAGIHLASPLGMQNVAVRHGVLAYKVFLPDEAEFTMTASLSSEFFGEHIEPVVTIAGRHLLTNHSTATMTIDDPPFQGVASPSRILSTLVNEVMLVVPTALDGALRFALPSYQKTLGDMSLVDEAVRAVAPFFSMPLDGSPVLSSGRVCVDKMKEASVELHALLLAPAALNVTCPVTFATDTIASFVASLDKQLTACGLGPWLMAGQDADSVELDDPTRCGVVQIRPRVRGNTVATQVKTIPPVDDVPLTFHFSGGEVPLFATWQDLADVIAAELSKDAPSADLQHYTVPQDIVEMEPALRPLYPKQMPAVGFAYSMGHQQGGGGTGGRAHANDTQLAQTLTAAEGKVMAELDGGRASLAMRSDVHMSFGVVLDCPPAGFRDNITIFSSLKNASVDKPVPPAPNNTLTLMLAGQMRDVNRTKRWSWEQQLQLEPGRALLAACQAAITDLPLPPEFLAVGTLMVNRASGVQVTITTRTHVFANGTAFIPDTLQVSNSTLSAFNDTSHQRRLNRVVVGDFTASVNAHLEASADGAELDVSILDLTAKNLSGTADVQMELSLAPEPVESVAAGASSSPARFVSQSADGFVELSRLIQALSVAKQFGAILQAGVVVRASLGFGHLAASVSSFDLLSPDANLTMTMGGEWNLSARGTTVAHMVGDFDFDVEFHGDLSFRDVMRRVMDINISAPCTWVGGLQSVVTTAMANPAVSAVIPATSKTSYEHLMRSGVVKALESVVSAACDGKSLLDLRLLCRLLAQATGSPVCAHSSVTASSLTQQLYLVLENATATDSYEFDTHLVAELEGRQVDLPAGEGAADSLHVHSRTTLNVTLVVAFGGGTPFPDVRISDGLLEVGLSANLQANVGVWIGPLKATFAQASVLIGDESNTSLPATMALRFGHGTPTSLAVQGQLDMSASVSIPFTPTKCVVAIRVPKLEAFALNPGPSTVDFSRGPAACPSVIGMIQEGVEMASFLSHLLDWGRLEAQFRLGWLKFLIPHFGGGGGFRGMKLPWLHLDWWVDQLHVHLGNIFGPKFFKALLLRLQHTLLNLELHFPDIAGDFLKIEQMTVKLFTEAMDFLLKPWTLSPIRTPDVSLGHMGTYNWTIALHGVVHLKPEEVGFHIGDHGMVHLNFTCGETAQFAWAVNLVLQFGPHGIRFLFPHDPVLSLDVDFRLQECFLLGVLGVVGLEVTASGHLQANMSVSPPSATADDKWKVNALIDGSFDADALLGFAGLLAQMMHKADDEAMHLLPNLRAGMNCSFFCGTTGCHDAPTCNFSKPEICLGQALEHVLTKFLALTDNKAYKNVRKIVDFLEEPMPLVDLFQRDYTVLDFAEFLAKDLCSSCTYENVNEVIGMLHDIFNLVDELKQACQGLSQPDGCGPIVQMIRGFKLNFNHSQLAPLPNGEPAPNSSDPVNKGGLPAPKFQAMSSTYTSVVKTGKFAVTMPCFKEPLACILKTIMGQMEMLVQMDFPTMAYSIAHTKVQPLWYLPPVWLTFTVKLTATLSAPSVGVPTTAVIDVLRSGDVGKLISSVALRAKDPETGAQLFPFKASISGQGAVHVTIFIASASASATLTLWGGLGLPTVVPDAQWITLGDFAHLIKVNGDVLKAMIIQVGIDLTVDLDIRACMWLPFHTHCWTIVHYHHTWSLWTKTVHQPKLFEAAGSPSGVYHLDAVTPYRFRRSPAAGAAAEGCTKGTSPGGLALDNLPTIVLVRVATEIHIDAHNPDDPCGFPANSVSTALTGDAIRPSGGVDPSFRFNLVVLGCLRAIEAAAAAGMSLHVQMRTFAASRGTSVFRVSRDSVIPQGSAGIQVTQCYLVNLSVPVASSTINTTGSACPLHIASDGSAAISVLGRAGDYIGGQVTVAGEPAGSLLVSLAATRIAVGASTVTFPDEAFTLTMSEPAVSLQVVTDVWHDSDVVVNDVPDGSLYTVQGGLGNTWFTVPSFSNVNGALTLNGGSADATNRLDVNMSLSSADAGARMQLVVSPTRLSFDDNSTGLRLVSLSNINEMHIDVTTGTGKMSDVVLLIPAPATFTSLVSHGSPTSLTHVKVTGCEDHTSRVSITLDGGEQILTFNMGKMRTNSLVQVFGSKLPGANDTIIIDVSDENSTIVWLISPGTTGSALNAMTTDNTVFFDLNFVDIEQLVIRTGPGTNRVSYRGLSFADEVLFQFHPAGDNYFEGVGSTVPIALMGPLQYKMSVVETTDVDPFLLFDAPVVIAPGDAASASLAMTSGRTSNIKQPVSYLFTERCASRSYDNGTAIPVSKVPSEWFLGQIAAYGVTASGPEDFRKCALAFYQNVTLQVATSQRASASVFVSDLAKPSSFSMGDAGNTFQARGFADDLTVSSGAGRDSFLLQGASSTASVHMVTGSGGDTVEVSGILGPSAVDFGSDVVADTLIVYYGQPEMWLATDRVGPFGPGPDDYVLLRNLQQQDPMMGLPGLPLFVPGLPRGAEQEPATAAGGRRIVHYHMPDGKRTDEMLMETNLSLYVDAIGDGTLLRCYAPSAGGPSGPRDWQVVSNVDNTRTAGTIVVSGPSDANFTVGAVLPGDVGDTTEITQREGDEGAIFVDNLVIRIDGCSHIFMEANESASVKLKRAPDDADVFLRANGVMSVELMVVTAPVVVENAFLEASYTQLETAGFVAAGGPNTALGLGLADADAVVVRDGCASVPSLERRTPSAWLASRAAHAFGQAAVDSWGDCNVFLAGVPSLRLTVPQATLANLGASSAQHVILKQVRLLTLEDDAAISSLALRHDQVVVDDSRYSLNLSASPGGKVRMPEPVFQDGTSRVEVGCLCASTPIVYELGAPNRSQLSWQSPGGCSGLSGGATNASAFPRMWEVVGPACFATMAVGFPALANPAAAVSASRVSQAATAPVKRQIDESGTSLTVASSLFPAHPLTLLWDQPGWSTNLTVSVSLSDGTNEVNLMSSTAKDIARTIHVGEGAKAVIELPADSNVLLPGDKVSWNPRDASFKLVDDDSAPGTLSTRAVRHTLLGAVGEATSGRRRGQPNATEGCLNPAVDCSEKALQAMAIGGSKESCFAESSAAGTCEKKIGVFLHTPLQTQCDLRANGTVRLLVEPTPQGMFSFQGDVALSAMFGLYYYVVSVGLFVYTSATKYSTFTAPYLQCVVLAALSVTVNDPNVGTAPFVVFSVARKTVGTAFVDDCQRDEVASSQRTAAIAEVVLLALCAAASVTLCVRQALRRGNGSWEASRAESFAHGIVTAAALALLSPLAILTVPAGATGMLACAILSMIACGLAHVWRAVPATRILAGAWLELAVVCLLFLLFGLARSYDTSSVAVSTLAGLALAAHYAIDIARVKWVDDSQTQDSGRNARQNMDPRFRHQDKFPPRITLEGGGRFRQAYFILCTLSLVFGLLSIILSQVSLNGSAFEGCVALWVLFVLLSFIVYAASSRGPRRGYEPLHGVHPNEETRQGEDPDIPAPSAVPDPEPATPQRDTANSTRLGTRAAAREREQSAKEMEGYHEDL